MVTKHAYQAVRVPTGACSNAVSIVSCKSANHSLESLQIRFSRQSFSFEWFIFSCIMQREKWCNIATVLRNFRKNVAQYFSRILVAIGQELPARSRAAGNIIYIHRNICPEGPRAIAVDRGLHLKLL